MGKTVIMDGNSAVAHVAHATNEVMGIYPITPSSNMGEYCDAKSAAGETNLWGAIPKVIEMQSEAGAAATVHGSLQAGALTCTFTASQGLLLKIPTMFKVAGELTPTVFHVSARAISAAALNIFGDHSDVYSARTTGFAFLASNNPQETMDMSLIAQAATLEGRVPVLHFFDGFRTSHELQNIEVLSKDDMAHMVTDELVKEYRERAMTPDRPILRGTAQNPDVYFQGREAVNKYYQAFPAIVQGAMDKFAKRTGRQYNLFEYVGAEDAERVIVIMGTGADTTDDTVKYLVSQGEKVGVVKVRLALPFNQDAFLKALPKSVKKIAVMDRTKEPGSQGEPMYHDVRTALGELMAAGKIDSYPTIVGGRYGLGSKEFIPAHVKAILDNLSKDKPMNHYVVGIVDDVTNATLAHDPDFVVPSQCYNAMFYGLGSDGTVGASKNTTKIIGDKTDNNVQAYFVYDSKKAGSMTCSHVRFSEGEINQPYLIDQADFVACHNWAFLEKYELLKAAKKGATFMINAPFEASEVWGLLPKPVQEQIIAKDLKVYCINASKIAEELGLGARINTIMQTAFFKVSPVIDLNVAITAIKDTIVKSYSRRGDKVVNMNTQAVDKALENVNEVAVGAAESAAGMKTGLQKAAPADADPFITGTLPQLLDFKGDNVPTSGVPADGTFPTATSQYEKRNIALNIPEWNEKTCVQCGICSFMCPHASIRMKVYEEADLKGAPTTFKSCDARGKDLAGKKYTLQVAPEDCTGCGLCVANCPAKAKEAIKMSFQPPLRAAEAANWDFFLTIPETSETLFDRATVKGSQLLQPLFEFSGACAGCGETPFVKLITQLFGDRMLVGNATGCSSIYGGNLPTTPYSQRADGRGPTWNNSLFEDTAEFSYGMRIACDAQTDYARTTLAGPIMACGCAACQDKAFLQEVLDASQKTQAEIEDQRARVKKLKGLLENCTAPESKPLLEVADYLVKKSVWAFGGDGWAYDIGYGGLDHVMAQGEDINLFVMDTEVYSNTGGQASKATPLGAVAQFAAGGKRTNKKDLAAIAMTYGHVYVARISLANPAQAVKAILEAEAYDGPSVVIAYSHCIAHGITMSEGVERCKEAVNSGHWPLFRYNPDLLEGGKNPLSLDSKEPTIEFSDFANNQQRFKVLARTKPEIYEELLARSNKLVKRNFAFLTKLAEVNKEIAEA